MGNKVQATLRQISAAATSTLVIFGMTACSAPPASNSSAIFGLWHAGRIGLHSS
jgi:hypothetical protein